MDRATILKACYTVGLARFSEHFDFRQAWLAEILCVNRAQVTKWMKGETSPRGKRKDIILELASIWDEYNALMKRIVDLIGDNDGPDNRA